METFEQRLAIGICIGFVVAVVLYLIIGVLSYKPKGIPDFKNPPPPPPPPVKVSFDRNQHPIIFEHYGTIDPTLKSPLKCSGQKKKNPELNETYFTKTSDMLPTCKWNISVMVFDPNNPFDNGFSIANFSEFNSTFYINGCDVIHPTHWMILPERFQNTVK